MIVSTVTPHSDPNELFMIVVCVFVCLFVCLQELVPLIVSTVTPHSDPNELFMIVVCLFVCLFAGASSSDREYRHPTPRSQRER